MKFRVKGKKKRMTEETKSEAPVIETETIRTPEGKEVSVPIQPYRAKVTTYFTIKAPVVTGEEAFKALAHLVWENMPAGTIGENFFVQFPRGFSDLQVNVDVQTLAEFNAQQEAVKASQEAQAELLEKVEELIASTKAQPAAEPQAEGTNG